MTWSSPDLAHHCLADAERTRRLIDVIKTTTRPGDVVLDAGAGTGVLGLAALEAGAGLVIALEADPLAAALLKRRSAEYGDRMEVHAVSVMDFASARTFDLVLAEMVDTWLLEEDFVPTLRHLRAAGCIDSGTHIIPAGYTWKLTFGSARFDYPFGLSCVAYQWPYYTEDVWQMPTFEGCASQVVLSAAAGDLALLEDRTHLSVDVPTGTFDAIRLEGEVWLLAGHPPIGVLPSVNAPIVIPLTRELVGGDGTTAVLGFEPGEGLVSLSLLAQGEEHMPWRGVPD